MNKAFVRDQDHRAEYCPHCGSQGQPVGEETLKAHLTPEQLQGISRQANFCPSPRCKVAYFDGLERVVLAADLARPIYPKDPAAPICPCFGFTVEDIEQDVREGVKTRVKTILEKAKSPVARCRERAGNGQPCVAYVQKHYVQCLERKA